MQMAYEPGLVRRQTDGIEVERFEGGVTAMSGEAVR